MSSEEGRTVVLALCALDERLWVYDEQSGINHPIPVTNFYNQLMLQKNIRDARVALDAKRIFRDMQSYTDRDLALAFRSYNKLRRKVTLEGDIVVEETKRSLLDRLKAVVRAARTR